MCFYSSRNFGTLMIIPRFFSVFSAFSVLGAIFLTLIFVSGCQKSQGYARRDPFVGETRLAPPATTRRAVYVRNDSSRAGNVLPGSSHVAAGGGTSADASRRTFVAGQNPETNRNSAVSASPAPSAVSSYENSRGGWIPQSSVPPNRSHDLNSPASVATGGSAEPYITRYGGEDAAEKVELRWIPLSAPSGNEEEFVHHDETPAREIPGNVRGVSYSRRFPYSRIIPWENGVIIPRHGAEEYPALAPERFAPRDTYDEKRVAEESGAWARSLDGPWRQETVAAARKRDTFQEEKERKIAVYFGNPEGETPIRTAKKASRWDDVCQKPEISPKKTASASAWKIVVREPELSASPADPHISETSPRLAADAASVHPKNQENTPVRDILSLPPAAK